MKKIKVECMAVFPTELPPRKFLAGWDIDLLVSVRGMAKYKLTQVFESVERAQEGLSTVEAWAKELNGRFTI